MYRAKKKTFVCDRCRQDTGPDRCELMTDWHGDGKAEHIDLCGECWAEFRKFLKEGAQ